MSNGYMRQVYICKDSNFSHKYTFCPVILYFIFEFYVLTVTNVWPVTIIFCHMDNAIKYFAYGLNIQAVLAIRVN